MRSKAGPVEFDSGNLEQGESFSFTFTVPGTYPYYDHRDRDETAYFGTIVVGAAADADGPLSDSGSVTIIDKSFQPFSVTVATGGIVVWRNDDGEAHTVTATDSTWDSGIMDGGATFEQTFTAPGSYPYLCLIHPEMRGSIEVREAADGGDVEIDAPELGDAVGVLPDGGAEASTTVSIIDRSYEPEAVEVAAGDSLRWTNDDSEGHTVTAVDGSFNSGVMTVGDEFTTTFEAPGTFDYFCAIHPEMKATVTVTP